MSAPLACYVTSASPYPSGDATLVYGLTPSGYHPQKLAPARNPTNDWEPCCPSWCFGRGCLHSRGLARQYLGGGVPVPSQLASLTNLPSPMPKSTFRYPDSLARGLVPENYQSTVRAALDTLSPPTSDTLVTSMVTLHPSRET